MTTRRQYLRGMTLGAGSALLSPMLRQIRAEADGDATAPPRFVFVVEGNGLDPTHVHPAGIPLKPREQRDAFDDVSLRELQLPEAIRPLAVYKDRMAIVQGLSGKIAGGGHSNNFGALGAYGCQGGTGNSGRAIDVTIDAALGKLNPSVFPIVNLGISQNRDDTVIYNSSCWAPGQKLPTVCHADLAYNMLFGSVASGDRQRDFQAEHDLLGFLADDIRHVESRLGGVDRERLQTHLAACESLRNRQDRLVEIRDQIVGVAPVPDDKYISTVETDRLDAMFDLAAAALIARLTNVVTIASGVGDPFFNITYSGLGINVSKHGIGHGGGRDGLTSEAMSIQIRQFHCELIVRLMKKLDAVPEGDGTMLDNTLIVYLSDAAEAHHSTCWEWPFVLLGNAGGHLGINGRYMVYPNYGVAGHRTINNLYNTLLHAAGTPRDDFGHADPILNDFDQSGPLSELLV